MFWKGPDLKIVICTPSFTKYTPFVLFCRFLSETSQNFMDSTAMGVNCSRVKLVKNYSPFTSPHTLLNTPPFFAFFTVPFPERLKTSRIPWGQVSSVRKWSNEVRILANDGPRMKLGYDSYPFLLIFYWR